jgi:pantoate--beta-alanine ligase
MRRELTVCRSLDEWRAARTLAEFTDCSIGFVPTMGALHAGHRSLLERASAENDIVVMSIFVNPTQFHDQSDLDNYPSMLESDLKVADGIAQWVLAPRFDELYPDGYRYRVRERGFSDELEGAHRPAHFDGVMTIVLKLLNLVRPTRAYFGEKDWQQLELVKGMAGAFFLPCEIVSCPTVRESDGLAMSSRNRRLSETARAHAAVFPRVLRTAKTANEAVAALIEEGFAVDYVEDRAGMRLGAVRIEGVRLIDNVPL